MAYDRVTTLASRKYERERLCRDLHDDLAPTFAGIRLRLEVLRNALEDEPRLRRLLAEVIAETRRAYTEMYRVADGLNPVDLDRDGLPGALRGLVDRLQGCGPTIVAELPVRMPPLRRSTVTAAYMIAAEGLANALRHAEASRVTLHIEVTPATVILKVVDDGVGLVVHRPDGAGGQGLRSIAERAREVGGHCMVLARSDSPSGTEICAVLPRGAR